MKTKGKKVGFDLSPSPSKGSLSEKKIKKQRNERRSKEDSSVAETKSNQDSQEGVIKLYMNNINDYRAEKQIIESSADDILITVGPLDRGLGSRMKAYNTVAEIIGEQTVEFLFVAGNHWFNKDKFLSKVKEWLAVHLDLFSTQRRISRAIAHASFFHLDHMDMDRSLYRILYNAYMHPSIQNERKLVVDKSNVGSVYKFALSSLLATVKYQEQRVISILNGDHFSRTIRILPVYQQFYVRFSDAISCAFNVFKRGIINNETLVELRGITIIVFDGMEKMKTIHDEVVIADIIWQLKLDAATKNKDISVFVYDGKSNKCDAAIAMTNFKMGKNIRVIKYDTGKYPNITVIESTRHRKKRWIHIYCVPKNISIRTTLQLTEKYPSHFTINADLNNIKDGVSTNKIEQFGPNVAFGHLWTFLNLIAYESYNAMAAGIKKWLNLNTMVYGEDHRKNIAKVVFAEMDMLGAQNMSKYQEQIYKMMKASYLNELSLDFERMSDEHILDPNVMDLLLEFVKKAFSVTFEDISHSIHYMLNNSHFAPREIDEWKEFIQRIDKEFYQTLYVSIDEFEKVFVTKQQTRGKIHEVIKTFQLNTDIISSFSNALIVSHLVQDSMDHDERTNIIHEIDIVSSSNTQKDEQMQTFLDKVVNGTNTEIIWYSIAYQSDKVSELPNFQIILAKCDQKREGAIKIHIYDRKEAINISTNAEEIYSESLVLLPSVNLYNDAGENVVGYFSMFDASITFMMNLLLKQVPNIQSHEEVTDCVQCMFESHPMLALIYFEDTPKSIADLRIKIFERMQKVINASSIFYCALREAFIEHKYLSMLKLTDDAFIDDSVLDIFMAFIECSWSVLSEWSQEFMMSIAFESPLGEKLAKFIRLDWQLSIKKMHTEIDREMCVILNIIKYYLGQRDYRQLIKTAERSKFILNKSMHLSFMRNQLFVMHQIFKWKTETNQDYSKDIDVVLIKDNDYSILNESLQPIITNIEVIHNRTISIQWFVYVN